MPRYFVDVHKACDCCPVSVQRDSPLAFFCGYYMDFERLDLLRSLLRPPFLESVSCDFSFLIRHMMRKIASLCFSVVLVQFVLSLPSVPPECVVTARRYTDRLIMDLSFLVSSYDNRFIDGGCERLPSLLDLKANVQELFNRGLLTSASLGEFCGFHVVNMTSDAMYPLVSLFAMCFNSPDHLLRATRQLLYRLLLRLARSNVLKLTLLETNPYHHYQYKFQEDIPFSSVLLLVNSLIAAPMAPFNDLAVAKELLEPLICQCLLACIIESWFNHFPALFLATLKEFENRTWWAGGVTS